MKHIIIFAVYAGSKEVSDCVSKCLARARFVYPSADIIAVNNKSVVDKWKSTTGITVIDNDSEYGYELGAYRAAIEHIKSINNELPEATYIFLQGTVWINAIVNIDQSMVNIRSFKHYNDKYELYNKPDHSAVLENILTILKQFPQIDWKWDTYDTLCASAMFVTNRLGLYKMINDSIFEIKCKTKQDSYAIERILGQYIKLITGNTTGIDGKVVHRSSTNHISNPRWETLIDYSSVIHKIFCDQL